MSRASLAFVAALALAVTLTGAAGASAFARARSEMGALLAWPGGKISYGFDASITDAERAAVRRAMATWQAVSCARIDFVERAALGDGGLLVIKRADLDDNALERTLAAKTELHPRDPRKGDVERGELLLAASRAFSSDVEARVAPSAFDLETVALHELGHALGLAHPVALTKDKSAVMTAGVSAGVVKRALGDDDAKGLCAIYPRSRE